MMYKSLQISIYVEKSTSTQIAGNFFYDFLMQSVLQLTILIFFLLHRTNLHSQGRFFFTSVTVK